MRRILFTWTAVVAAAVIAIVLLTGACGNKAEVSTGGGDGGGTGAQLSNPDDVFAKAREGANNLTGVKYVADLEVTGTPNPSATSSSTVDTLAQNLKVHVDGAMSKNPTGAQLAIDLTASGQSVKAELRVNDSGVYVGFGGQWYVVPPEQSDKLVKLATATPADTMKSLGLDIGTLESQRTLAGTETIDGATCYHVVAKPDPKQVAEGIVKALNNPILQDQSASDSAAGMGIDPAQVQKLGDMLKQIDLDYWVDAQTGYVRKGSATIKVEAPAGDTSSSVQSMDIKLTFTASGFNEKVTVESPPSPLPFSELGSALFGGGD
jgi:hypothetical protein